MPTDRSRMTVQVVPLDSPEAGEARVGGTAAERLALVTQLSESSWALTRRPLPSYTRATMPIVISQLGAPANSD
jgi:hypothetical protein